MIPVRPQDSSDPRRPWPDDRQRGLARRWVAVGLGYSRLGATAPPRYGAAACRLGRLLLDGPSAVPPLGVLVDLVASTLGRVQFIPHGDPVLDDAWDAFERWSRRAGLRDALEEARRAEDPEGALLVHLERAFGTPGVCGLAAVPGISVATAGTALGEWPLPTASAGDSEGDRRFRVWGDHWIRTWARDLDQAWRSLGGERSPATASAASSLLPGWQGEARQSAVSHLRARAAREGRLADVRGVQNTFDAPEAAALPPRVDWIREKVRAAATALAQRRHRHLGGGYVGLRFNAGLEAVPDWLPRNFALPRDALVFSAQERRLAARQRPEDVWPRLDVAFEIGVVQDGSLAPPVREPPSWEAAALLQDLARHFRLPPPLRAEVRLRRLHRDDPTGERGLSFRFRPDALPEPGPHLAPAAVTPFAGGPWPGWFLQDLPGAPLRPGPVEEGPLGLRVDVQAASVPIETTFRLLQRPPTGPGARDGARLRLVLRGSGGAGDAEEAAVLRYRGAAPRPGSADLWIHGVWDGTYWRLAVASGTASRAGGPPLTGPELRCLVLASWADRLARPDVLPWFGAPP